MTEFEKVIMSRDGVSKSEARRERDEARSALYDIIEEGGSYADVEDMLLYDYGLEMDYLLDLI